MLQLAVINESTAIASADVQTMIPARSQQWNHDLKSVWGIDSTTSPFRSAGTSSGGRDVVGRVFG